MKVPVNYCMQWPPDSGTMSTSEILQNLSDTFKMSIKQLQNDFLFSLSDVMRQKKKHVLFSRLNYGRFISTAESTAACYGSYPEERPSMRDLSGDRFYRGTVDLRLQNDAFNFRQVMRCSRTSCGACYIMCPAPADKRIM